MTLVLIVDDNLENLYLLRALLKGHGFSVEEARHGVEALSKARLNPPDLVVSDLLMPMMDGYTLLRQWKADERLKAIPFVVYTATYTEPRDERLAIALGARAFIIKPAEPDAFMVRIRNVLAVDRLPETTEHQMEETVLLNEYNEVLVRKLEKKALELEQSNRELLAEIAERKQAEKALRLRDRAIQSVSQGILITVPSQPDNPIIYASTGFERMTGYRLEEVIGKNCRFLQGKDTDRDTVAKIREAIKAGHACEVEILNYRKDGTPFWNALSLNPIFDETGVLTHFVGVQNDVTERKLLEEQLRQAQKMEAVGRLAGGVAHDFNNLLMVINGRSQIAMTRFASTDDTRKDLELIYRTGERAAALTRQLLAFSRQQVVTTTVVNINVVAADMDIMLRRLIREDIEFKTVLDPSLKCIKADPGQIEQVIMNLVINACDAMPHGGKIILETNNAELDAAYCGIRADVIPGRYVMLSVTDSGLGMNETVKSRIFEPFFTTKPKGKGTGLGLATVFGIVKQSRGHIDVYSEPDMGTAFKVYFPQTQELSSAATVDVHLAAPSGHEVVLLVEDEEEIRKLVHIILESNGYKVLIASNGKEAMALCRTHAGTINLVITDVVMPEMGGAELAAYLKATHPTIKVLFTSGYTDNAIVNNNSAFEATAFIQKPFTMANLARKVRDVLDGR